MAGLSFAGIIVDVVGSKIPTGYTKPTVTPTSGPEYQTIEKTYTVPKAGIEDANKVTTFTALVAALDTAIQAELSADFTIATLDVEAYTVFTNVYLDSCGTADGSNFYNATAPSYVCSVVTYVKTT